MGLAVTCQQQQPSKLLGQTSVITPMNAMQNRENSCCILSVAVIGMLPFQASIDIFHIHLLPLRTKAFYLIMSRGSINL